MVSLDAAVLARLEKGGKRYEILVDPELVDLYKRLPEKVEWDDLLATDEVWHDARGGERPTAEAIEATFATQDIHQIAAIILKKGNIQLTTGQRKGMVEEKRLKIINSIVKTAVDPKTKLPHPAVRIENALDESRYSVDPFKTVDTQVKEVLVILKQLIPLSFETCKLAFRVSGRAYGGVSQLLRPHMKKEQWLENGDWACVVVIPAALKADLISQVASRDSNLSVKEM
jgi:ribosome maturation protein SDO1